MTLSCARILRLGSWSRSASRRRYARVRGSIGLQAFMPNATINNFNIHYERGGQGPLLVLLHGIGSNARSWAHQLQALAAHYDVVAWDMRGYGSSSDPMEAYSMSDVAEDV